MKPFSIDVLYWEILDDYVYGPATITERVARVTKSPTCTIFGGKIDCLHRDREAFVCAKIEDLQAYNAAIGNDGKVMYEEPAEDEKLEYWMRNTNKEESFSVISHPSTGPRWWRRLPPNILATLPSGRTAGGLSICLSVIALGLTMQKKLLK